MNLENSRNRFKSVLICILILPTISFSQFSSDFLRPFFGYYDSQSLTNAICGATVASGHVIPGKTSNPANLGLHRFNHLQTGSLHGSFKGSDADRSHTNFGGIYAILPIKVYQGSLVFGLGVHKVVDFTDALIDTVQEFSEKGGIYAYGFGASVEVIKDLFIGGEFQYLNGEDNLLITEVDSSFQLNPGFSGFNMSFGFVQRLTANAQFGASVQFPTYIWVDEKITEWPSDSTHKSLQENYNYRLRRPFVFHFGFALLFRYLNIFYEAEWSDWRDLNFSSDEYYAGDIAEINREIEAELRSTLTIHTGIALHPPWLPAHIYVGYQYLPVPNCGVYTSNKRESLSFGSSFMLNQQFSIHGSYAHYYWKYSGVKERYGMLVFGISLHY